MSRKYGIDAIRENVRFLSRNDHLVGSHGAMLVELLTEYENAQHEILAREAAREQLVTENRALQSVVAEAIARLEEYAFAQPRNWDGFEVCRTIAKDLRNGSGEKKSPDYLAKSV